MIRPRIGIYGVLEKTEEGWKNAESIVSAVREKLIKVDVDVQVAKELVYDEETAMRASEFFELNDPDLLLAVIITWSFDNLTLSIFRRVARPIAILAVPGIRSGSLVGAQQLGCLLTDLGIEHSVFFGTPECLTTYKSIAAYAKAITVARRLERGKIGNVGQRTPGMTPVAFDEVEVTRLFGPQIISYGWEEIEEQAQGLSGSRIDAQENRIRSLADKIHSTEQSLYDSAQLYLALRNRIQSEGLIAVSLGCYPNYAGKVCIACSLLGDEGIPCACEGDLNSSLAMFLLQSFSDQSVHFGEILEVNEKENSIVTSHCGCCPLSLAASRSQVAIAPVRLFEKGACVRFPVKSGPVTFVNLVGRRGTYRVCAVQGEAVETGMIFEGNPVKIRVQIPVRDFLEIINKNGFGHHWMMGYGHVVEELKYFCKISGLRGFFP